MSRMAEQQMQEDDWENLSGMDDYLAWVDWMERDKKRIEEERKHNNEAMYQDALRDIGDK